MSQTSVRSEELFTDDPFEGLTVAEFEVVAQIAISNDKISDTTGLCYQMFHNVMEMYTLRSIFDSDIPDLDVIAKYIQFLQASEKFDHLSFCDMLERDFSTIPLEIVWWLHKNNIMYFSQYCIRLKPLNIPSELLQILDKNLTGTTFNSHVIVDDLLFEIIRGYYRPNLGICRLSCSKAWADQCCIFLNNLIKNAFQPILQEKGRFVNFLQCLDSSKKYLPSVMITRLYKNILNKILLHNVQEYDLNDAYTLQQLWCTEKMNNNLILLFSEIFARYCNLQTILQLLEENEVTVNWKYILAAVSVCVKQSPTGSSDIKNAVMNLLEQSFKGAKSYYFTIAVLFIRQACMEQEMKLRYSSWYSQMFGRNSTYKTTINSTLFQFLIKMLISLIPHEPKAYLKTHIEQTITAPPKCNNLVFIYKDLCRARLEELKQSPVISVEGVELNVLQMVEQICRADKVTPVVLSVINNQRNEFYSVMVPQILRDKAIFVKVKELLLKGSYLTKEILYFTKPDPEGKVFDEEDDDLILPKKL